MKSLIILVALFAATAFAGPAADLDAKINAMTMPQLEAQYWDCDYASTMSMADFSDAMICSKVFERLKKDRFKGDFTAFMSWWQANKTKEHQARAILRPAPSSPNGRGQL